MSDGCPTIRIKASRSHQCRTFCPNNRIKSRVGVTGAMSGSVVVHSLFWA